jgi:predicted small metal-binding protein
MDRDCKNCVYHSSGSCSQWDCNFTTINDVRNEAIDDTVKAIKKLRAFTVLEEEEIDEMARQLKLKVGDKNEQIR